MITAQDIREKTFEKSRMNGYDMASVDDFLEELANDIGSAQKENAVLKSKMKVLVDKIEEYRANEEALNLAILSAQKLAVQIEAEARQRAASMIEDAERQVQERVGSIQAQTEAEERKLADAKEATRKFFESARDICGNQLRKLEAISNDMELPMREPEAVPEPAAEPAAEEAPADLEEAVRSIEQGAAAAVKEEDPGLDLSDFEIPPAPKRRSLGSTQSFNL